MRLLLLATLLAVSVGDAQPAPRRTATGRRRPMPTVPPPGPHVRDNSRPEARAHPDRPPESASTPPAPPPTSATPLPWPVERPALAPAPIWAGPLAPPAEVPHPEQAPAPAPTPPATRDGGIGLRWFGGAVMAPAPLIPATATAPAAFAPSFLTQLGLEVDRRVYRPLHAYVSLVGGYGQVDDTPRLRGFGTRRSAWFAVGSGLGTIGVQVPVAVGPLVFVGRAGTGARVTVIDVPRVAWEIAPASELGVGLRLGRGRWAVTVDARSVASRFNADRLPLARRISAPVIAVREALVTTGLRRQF